ncbi:MAG: leucine-rich repeat protein [Lachnospiraceae bacterium]|nr:leucine-rich repeat protein [Lachnospiraceae bacterium]
MKQKLKRKLLAGILSVCMIFQTAGMVPVYAVESKAIVEQDSEETVEEVVEAAKEEASGSAEEEAAGAAKEEAAGAGKEEATGETIQGATEENKEETTGETIQEATEEIKEETTGETIQEATEETTEESTEETTEPVTEEATESEAQEKVCLCDPVVLGEGVHTNAKCPYYKITEIAEEEQTSVEKLIAMIDALPNADEITHENRETAQTDFEAVWKLYEALYEDETIENLDEQIGETRMAKLIALREVLLDMVTLAEGEVYAVYEEGTFYAATADAPTVATATEIPEEGKKTIQHLYSDDVSVPGKLMYMEEGGGSSLQTVIMPNAESIGARAFWVCEKLTSVELPVAITIGNDAFSGCLKLTSAGLPAATTIGDYAFFNCSGLTSVELPTATTIGDRAFAYCSGLTSVELPVATAIRDYAFVSCIDLTSVELPAAISIGNYAFDSCSALNSLKLGTTPPTSVGANAFANGSESSNPRKLTILGASEIADDAIRAYKAVDDGNTGDKFWYGWTLPTTLVSPSTGTLKITSGNTEAEYLEDNTITLTATLEKAPTKARTLSLTENEIVLMDGGTQLGTVQKAIKGPDGKWTATFTNINTNTWEGGKHRITAQFAGNTDLNSAKASTVVTITPLEQKELKIEGVPATATYGDPINLSVSGGTGDGKVTYASSNSWVIGINSTESGTTAIIRNAGTATITATKSGGKNYKDATATVTITVSPAAPTLTWEETAQSTTYTGSPILQSVLKKPVVRLLEGDTYNRTIQYAYKDIGGLTRGLFAGYIDGLPTDAGKYEIKAYIAAGGNYTAAESTNTMKLTVDKFTPTLKINTMTGKTYDGTAVANPTAKQMTIEGASYADVKFTYSNNSSMTGSQAVPPKDVGTWYVQAFIEENANTKAVKSAAVKFTISKASATEPDTDGGSGSGGSSNSGSGGSSNSGSGSNTIDADIPAAPMTTVADVKPVVDKNGNATIAITDNKIEDAIKKAQDEAKKNGTTANGIAIVINGATDKIINNITAELPKSVQDKLIASGVKNVTIQSGAVDISIDLEALKEIRGTAASDVNITAAKMDNSKLSAEARKAVGNHPVFDFKVTGANGKIISDFGKGSVCIAIPYILAEGEKAGNIVAVHITDAGKVKYIRSSSYNEKSGKLLLITNHFSIYGIAYKADTAATTFSDIADHWAKESIEFAVVRDLFTGTGMTLVSGCIMRMVQL